MSHLAKLKSATSRKELALILGYKPKSMTAIVYKTPTADKYATFDIDKKSGGKRTIKAPAPKLKNLQSHLSHVLYQCLAEIDRARDAKPISFGFRQDRSITENASRHKRRRWVLNLDLEDFFPSFNFGRVRGFFLKDKAFDLHPEVATTIAQIACDGTALPQGSPCSPVISELIAQILDMRLVRLAKKHGVTYTRYADDITFSTSQKDFPAGLAQVDESDPSVWHLSDELTRKIVTSGFAINNAKTRMNFRGSRQIVTGLVVNEKVNIRSDYYRRARAMCDTLFQTGQYYKAVIKPDDADEEPKPEVTSNLNPLQGILGHIYAVTQSAERREVSEQRQNPRAIRKLFRRFLFYKYCIVLNEPLIVTEGKTDPVYLREAVKSRVKFQPMLGAHGKDGFKHAVRYFNYGGLAHEVMDLGGGTGDLKSIPLDYLRNLKPSKGTHKPFAYKPMKYPVIIVLDNDDGLAAVASTVKKNFGTEIDKKSTQDFYNVIDNLYIVKTPEDGSKNTCIEDMFPKEWREYKINGKKLNTASKIDPSKDLSKEAFAKSVVKANADKIDFSGFDPLLERICKAVQHYAAKS
ncbi:MULTISPECIES: retron Ec67 family RNA-directed DNA polymerase/endonuclease [Acetobacteraceae]|uniref:RNA-directed DNA polymerase n=1 Tax=Gluconacetobacter entanii TaxID=108528 RepID=A0ABT3K2B7_9PROT|nr:MULTISPECIES: retron Ec67 family RNA-directed DNA polymerase/endonuclease [Acetobacteraceae]MCW4589547.1 retron Ec67 family RNA-directed DNA polymerase/endonuclease [Gluconacetobacter entanii]MCW4593356.1 retron Ec67 family RNA-directed DNA polymerase/endonuclease [Gluconacetobacter entanii]